jgi:protein SCO1/2
VTFTVLRAAGLACVASGLLFASTAQALEGVDRVPKELEGVGVDEKLGTQLDLGLDFVDHNGKTVKLGDYVADGKALLLSLNYYRCTMLCSLQLNGLVDGLRSLDWPVGQDFRMVTVSINPDEGPELAAGKRANYLEVLGQEDADWSFLTGRQENISALAEQVGFEYRYDERSGEYAHAAVLYAISPDGTISRYLYGIQFPDHNLRFAIMDASQGKVGSTIDRLILSCFHYISSEGRYTPFAFGVMRLGALGGLTVVALLLFVMWSRERLRGSNALVEATT